MKTHHRLHILVALVGLFITSLASAQNTFSFAGSGCFDKKFGTFMIPATHNSFCAPPSFISPNQNSYTAIPAQLTAGVRFIEIDLHKINGTIYCVHGTSIFSLLGGSRNPVTVFQEIVTWLNANPNELVFIKLQETLTDTELTTVLQQSGALAQAHVLAAGVRIESLTPRQIVDSGRRLLFVGTSTVGVRSLADASFAYSAYDLTAVSQLNPAIVPGTRALHNLVAYVSPAGVGSPGDAGTINAFAFLRNFVEKGWRQNGRRPFSAIVDFQTLGSPIQVVSDLNINCNGITGSIIDPATGRAFTSMGWQNSFGGVAVNGSTHGNFNFPVRRNTVTFLKPVKAGYRFEPVSVTVSNTSPFTDYTASFTAIAVP